MDKLLVAAAMALSAAAIPARAFADERSRSAEPIKLTDADLDEVTAGTGPPAFVLAAGHGPPFARNRIEPQPSVTNIGTQVNSKH